MSLIPFTFLEEPQHFLDNFFSSPFHPSLPSTNRTVPCSELNIETSGKVRAKVECKEVEGAHLIIAELSGVDKHRLNVSAEEDGFVTINASTGQEEEDKFFWRGRVPSDANLGMLSWSMENGVLTVVLPKTGVDYFTGGWDYWGDNTGRTNVRQIDIQGCD